MTRPDRRGPRSGMGAPIAAMLASLLLGFGPTLAADRPCGGCGSKPVSSASSGPSPKLVAELSGWVAGELGLAIELPPPDIRVVPNAQLPVIAAELSGQPVQGRDFVALYIPGRRQMLLSEGWDAGSIRDRSVVVHELVHHADAVSGFQPRCGAEREARAYDVQKRWLEARGTTLQDTFGIDAFTLLILTTCDNF